MKTDKFVNAFDLKIFAKNFNKDFFKYLFSYPSTVLYN